MSNNEEECCQKITSRPTKLDSFSQKVAEKLSGKAIQERIEKESKIFSGNRLCKWSQDK
jgi:hypothetical protein